MCKTIHSETRKGKIERGKYTAWFLAVDNVPLHVCEQLLSGTKIESVKEEKGT